MDTLTPLDASHIAIRFTGTPIVSGERAEFSLVIENGTGKRLSSSEPNPTRLVTFFADSSEPYLGDWPRHATPIDVEAGKSTTICSSHPIGKGGLLVATLVQENVMWLHLAAGVLAKCTVEIPKWWLDKSEVVFGEREELNQSRFRNYFSCGDKQRPLMLHVETVNICNLKCIICPYNEMKRTKETMPDSLFAKIVADYVAMGGGDVIITPSVGDVFLDKRLVCRVKHLQETPGIRSIGFVTNGGNAGVFDDEDLSFIINACTRINISVYGLDEEENATMTRRPEKYNKILEQIKRIMRLNRCCSIALAFRLLKQNAKERAETWMLDNFGKVFPHEILTSFGNWAGAIDITKPLPFAGMWSDDTSSNPEGKPCAYPLLHVKVAVNGDVKFCSCIDYDSTVENIIGNVKEKSLLDIYNSERARQLWGAGLSICKGCTHFKPLSILGDFYPLLDTPIRNLGV